MEREEEESLTPVRGMKLSFNSSNENLNPMDLDAAIDLTAAKSYSKSEANQILEKAHTEDTKRFEPQTRRTLFTEKESKFNKLRRMNSCGNQLPRLDEKYIGRNEKSSSKLKFRSKTIDETGKNNNKFMRKTTNTPRNKNLNSSKSELDTDRLFEIAIRSRSCSRHRSDSITPLRKHSSAKSNALHPDDVSPPCSPLRLNTTRSNDEIGDFFERFSDDGFMEENEDNLSDLENEMMGEPNIQIGQQIHQNLQNDIFPESVQTTQISSTPSRLLFNPQPSESIEISPLVAPLLARNRQSRTPTKFSTPNSMNKLMNGKIIKKSTRRGLFQEPTKSLQHNFQNVKPITPKSILRSPRSRTPNKKRKFTQITESPLKISESLKSPVKRVQGSSPVKRFASPDTPSKIRCRRRKLSYSRTKSVTYNVTALRQTNPNCVNVNNSPGLRVFSSIGSKNYRCSTDQAEQEKVKLSLDRIASCENNVYSGNHMVKKLDLETVAGSGKHPQLTYITGSTLANLMAKSENQSKQFKILDCRYPYEYKGGHIKSATNISKEIDLFNRFFNPETSSYSFPPNDTVLIFHCEFSSERAPKMMKKLREMDRKMHKYPDLKFPELYLLKDGYKEFYENFSEFCDGEYVPMLDSSYKQEFDNFRKMREKSKTWSDGALGETVKVGKRGKRRLF
jgi:rhodanese-related sulfurtransferase